jgi:hypothetical protein
LNEKEKGTLISASDLARFMHTTRFTMKTEKREKIKNGDRVNTTQKGRNEDREEV